jgi:hypothetical protein
MIKRFTARLRDERRANLIEHEMVTLVGQGVFAIALAYQDLNAPDEGVMAVAAGKVEGVGRTARRSRPSRRRTGWSGANLSRPATTRSTQSDRHQVDLFLETHERASSALCALVGWRVFSGREQ